VATGFQQVGLIGKYGDPNIRDRLVTLQQWLKLQGMRVLLDESTAQSLPDLSIPIATRQEIGERCDLVIVIGGDGSFLNAARSLADFPVALLGVNLGRLGFLADISPTDMTQTLGKILAGDYVEEKRLLVQAQILRNDEVLFENCALNDIVLHQWDVARMIEMETSIDGHHVYRLRADGLIVSTPTGSTAYALSGGGPIIHPELELLELVPICPHTLNNRPLVVSASSNIEILLCDNNQTQAQITFDGQNNYRLEPGDRIRITRREKRIRLLHPVDQNYFSILRAKLNWGQSS